jgi:hypothetical protein
MHGLFTYTCAGAAHTFVNNLTVAILNSNAHSHVHKRGNYEDYSPCKTFFDLGSILQHSISAENFSDRLSSSDFGQTFPGKTTIVNLS